jgi:protein-S-isoprenylcysteine O-methyltransferase Ste14
MGASNFEFRYRFWTIGLIFGLGFFLYNFDHKNVSVALAEWLAGSTSSPKVDLYVRIIFAIGSLLVILSALIRTWATAYLRTAVVHDAALHNESLMASGPFRRVRNPLYFGNLLLAIGLGTMASRLGFLVIVIGMFLVVYRLVLREEAGLKASQGESYREFLARVPRFLPAFSPRVPAGDGVPNWGDGFLGELLFWGFALAMVVFTITLRVGYAWAVMALGFAAYFLQFLRLNKKAKSI